MVKDTNEYIFKPHRSHLDSVGGRPLLLSGRPLVEGQFGYPVYPLIFPSSLVMLSPRWDQDSYKRFYETQYDNLYRLDLRPDVGVVGIKNNTKEILDRIVPLENDIGESVREVLDLGAGPGFGLPMVKERFGLANVSVIEGSPASRKVIEDNKFGNIIGHFLDNVTAKKYSASFDLIIMRHVVEHLLEPVVELGYVRELMKPSGRLYISVPDMMNPRTDLRDYHNWWEYWFRSVHAYYYNIHTLFATLSLAGLSVVSFGQENQEIWCIVTPSSESSERYTYDYRKAYSAQLAIIEELLP